MKTTTMTMAAIAALAVAVPASAQRWEGRNSETGEMRMRIDAGIQSGAISRRELTPLRASLRQLVNYERQFAANGFSRRERAFLEQRSETLSQQIYYAERSGGRYGRNRNTAWEGGRDDRNAWNARFEGPNRGDRFAGDVRVGQRTNSRMVAMPMQLRDEYRDNDEVYYRYHNERIYQVDRTSGLILGLLDLPNSDK